MSVREVTMYRVVCDQDNCDKSPQDGDTWAWTTKDVALEDARYADWAIRGDLHLCLDHSHDVCMGNDESCPRLDTTEADDGWRYCPDHISEGMDG